MNTPLRFALRGALTLVIGAIFGVHLTLTAALPAEAATAPSWQWSDISSTLSARSDRPVWAMAYTNAGWIGTDGQDLVRKGRVWKTDGIRMTDLTTDAKDAGLYRVDAIVGDGQSAMLLQNPGRNDEVVVSYDNGFRNRSAELNAQLVPGETIAAIAGKNGSWLVLTTKGNVLEWSPSLLSFVKRATFADGVANHLPQAALRFRITQNVTDDTAQTAVLPMASGWLIVIPSNGNVPQNEYYVYADGNATEVSNLFPGLGTLSTAASNGSQAVVIGADRGYPWNVVGYAYDGTNVSGISNFDKAGLNRSAWTGAKLTWTGSAWSAYAIKHSFRIQDNALTVLPQSRDLFVTAASNNRGTVLLGGVTARKNASTHVDAKLVRLNESTVIAGKTTNASSGLKTSAWTWTEPTLTQMTKDQSTSYRVGAWSPSGIKTIEVRANGTLIQYCGLNGAQGNQLCTVTVKGSDYASTGLVTLQGTVTDGAGNVVVTNETAIAVTSGANVSASNGSSVDMAAWGWFESQPYVARNGVVSFRTQAYASTGLSRIEIYVNANLRKTCYFWTNTTELQGCDSIIFGNEYVEGTYGVWVKAYDVNNTVVQSQNYNLTFTHADTSGNEMNSVAAVSVGPDKGKYMPDDTAMYTIDAADPDGIVKIEILVDWQTGTVCNTNTYDVASCGLSFEGYKNAGKDRVIISRITDKRGNVVWTGMKTLSFAASRDTAAKSVAWVSPNVDSIRQDGTAIAGATAYAGNDVRQIELYVNGASKRTCTYADGYTEKNCSVTLKGSDYAGNSTVTIQAKSTDSRGNSFWSASKGIRIAVDTSGLWYGDQPTLQLWTSRGAEGNVTLTANGQSPAGVQRIDILVNGSSVATCGNKTTCTWTGPVSVTGATFSATMVDMYGRFTWSGYQIAKTN